MLIIFLIFPISPYLKVIRELLRYKIEDNLSRIGISCSTLDKTSRIFSRVYLNDPEMTLAVYRTIKSFKPGCLYVTYLIKDKKLIIRQNYTDNNSTENDNLIIAFRVKVTFPLLK